MVPVTRVRGRQRTYSLAPFYHNTGKWHAPKRRAANRARYTPRCTVPHNCRAVSDKSVPTAVHSHAKPDRRARTWLHSWPPSESRTNELHTPKSREYPPLAKRDVVRSLCPPKACLSDFYFTEQPCMLAHLQDAFFKQKVLSTHPYEHP